MACQQAGCAAVANPGGDWGSLLKEGDVAFSMVIEALSWLNTLGTPASGRSLDIILTSIGGEGKPLQRLLGCRWRTQNECACRAKPELLIFDDYSTKKGIRLSRQGRS